MSATVTAVCARPGCVVPADPSDGLCDARTDAYGGPCMFVYNIGRYDEPPEPCDQDAEPGTDRCSLHSEDTWGEDEEDHEYWDD